MWKKSWLFPKALKNSGSMGVNIIAHWDRSSVGQGFNNGRWHKFAKDDDLLQDVLRMSKILRKFLKNEQNLA